MPSTHTSLHYHLVFSTKNRAPFIDAAWGARLHEYLGGTIRNMDGIPLGVGGVNDHVHLLVTLKPVHLLADVLRDVKRSSSAWVRGEVGESRFAWQEGYGAFTVGRSNLERVRQYVLRQEEHHRVRSFQEEYRMLLHRHGVAFDERFLW